MCNVRNRSSFCTLGDTATHCNALLKTGICIYTYIHICIIQMYKCNCHVNVQSLKKNVFFLSVDCHSSKKNHLTLFFFVLALGAASSHCQYTTAHSTHWIILHSTVTHCNTQQHNASHYIILPHTATRCNTLQLNVCISCILAQRTLS